MIMAARDADGIFDFIAVGVENAQEGTAVETMNADEAQMCSRKRFLEMRAEGDGLSPQQMRQRAMAQMGMSDSKTTVKVIDGNGKAQDISNQQKPRTISIWSNEWQDGN